MFSKFKLQTATNPNVIYRRGPRRFEAERSTDIISVPLLEHYDRTIRALRAENSAQYQELVNARAEAFQLREQLKLLHEEVKNKVKFNTSKKSNWTADKTPRCKKRMKIRQLVTNATEKLPAEFKPIEVSSL